GDGVRVGGAVRGDFVAGGDDHTGLVREGLDGVAGDEPGGFKAVFVKKLEQAGDADLAGEEAARDVVGRVLPPVRTEPPPYGVNINPVRDFNLFRAHDRFLLLSLTRRSVG